MNSVLLRKSYVQPHINEFNTFKDKEDLLYAERKLANLPENIASTLFNTYVYKWNKNPRKANIWINLKCKSLSELLKKIPIATFRIKNDIQRAVTAKFYANQCIKIYREFLDRKEKPIELVKLLQKIIKVSEEWGISPQYPNLNNFDERKDKLNFYYSIIGLISRLLDSQWWEKQLHKIWIRCEEHISIIIGKVKSGTSLYISDKNLKEYSAKKQAQINWLNSNFAINEEKELQFLLSEIVATSQANPSIRRAELMVRMRGFEQLAEEKGFVGKFITWTAPSRFHCWKKNKEGKCYPNNKYDNSTPKDTQKYLCKQWAKCRAKLARKKINNFGFRVVEPHHDATPHWHLMLFIDPTQVNQAISIMEYYALEHDKEDFEKLRNKNIPCPRFNSKTIDPNKGSATGYIAKYIAKNIDRSFLNNDSESNANSISEEQRAPAWSSFWNIRQFQQIGGPSVTIWRELRRLKNSIKQDTLFEKIRNSADCSSWNDFVDLMGGVNCSRKNRPLQILKEIEKEANQYGEDVKRVIGIYSDLHTEITRIGGWIISKDELRSDAFVSRSLSGGNRAPWSTDNNCTQPHECLTVRSFLMENLVY